MKAFAFQLASLLQLRRNQRDAVRRVLAGILQHDDELRGRSSYVEAQRRDQIDELRKTEAEGALDVEASLSRRNYIVRLTEERAGIERQREVAAERIAGCRHDLLAADQAVESLEKLAEARRIDFDARQERSEAFELEETWRALHAMNRS